MPNKLNIQSMISSMATALEKYLKQHGIKSFELVGIRTGGVWVAHAVQKHMNNTQTLGELDISFYRDDFTQVGLNPKVSPSKLPFSPEDKHIILFDDVLMSGRTVRAAMNELFDYGRPASITLAVLVDLGRRELPIYPTIVGSELTLTKNEHIKLVGPDNLHFDIQRIDQSTP